MLETSHSLIGASLSQLIPQPTLGIPLNILTHFLTDLFPHWDLRTRKISQTKSKLIFQSLTDAAIGLSLGWWLFHREVNSLYLLAMMFSAQLPDWIEAPYLIFNWNFFPFASMKKLQSRLHWKLNLPWGLVGQILLVIAFILLAKLGRHTVRF